MPLDAYRAPDSVEAGVGAGAVNAVYCATASGVGADPATAVGWAVTGDDFLSY